MYIYIYYRLFGGRDDPRRTNVRFLGKPEAWACCTILLPSFCAILPIHLWDDLDNFSWHVAQIQEPVFVHFDGKQIRPDVVHVAQKLSLQLCISLKFKKALDNLCQEQNYTNFIPCNCANYTMRICPQKTGAEARPGSHL